MRLNIPGATEIPEVTKEPKKEFPADPPNGLREMLEVFGNPDPVKGLIIGYKASSKWESQYCATLSASQLAGYHRRIYMHKLVAAPFKEALRLSYELLGDKYKLLKIGCFNPRHKQFNQEMGWSTHTWAVAFDINPDTNKAFNRLNTPSEFEPGWTKHSDLPEELVTSFEQCGFTWGGRWGKGESRYCDPMHFQYCSGY